MKNVQDIAWSGWPFGDFPPDLQRQTWIVPRKRTIIEKFDAEGKLVERIIKEE